MKTIRDYRVSDRDAVISVFQRSVLEVASRDYSPAQLTAWSPAHPDPEMWSARLRSGGVFVCLDDGAITGFTRIDRAGHIDLLYVHPKFQNQGVARALLKRAVEWARLRGAQRLTADASLTARGFFERAGFQIVRSHEVECRGILFRNFHMERSMEAEPCVGSNAAAPRASA